MKLDVKVPAVGESITEAVIGSWTKKSGEFVKMNEVIMLLETDKASVEVIAEKDGVLTINAQAGDTVKIGATVGSIDTDAKAPAASAAAPAKAAAAPSQPAAGASSGGGKPTHPELQAHQSPAVQRVVNERGLDVSNVQGTGLGGRLTKGDVLNAPASAPAPSAPAAKAPAAPTVTPVPRGPSKQGDIQQIGRAHV